MQAHTAFAKAYGGHFGTNFMTPNIIRIGIRGAFAIELSHGRGIENDPIYGVTVVEITGKDTARKRPDLSQVFFNRTDADQHIRAIEV